MKKKLYKYNNETVVIWDISYIWIKEEEKAKVEYCLVKDGILGERRSILIDKDYLKEFVWDGERIEVNTGNEKNNSKV